MKAEIPRNISKSIKKYPKSILLLGPRQVGKSTLIKSLKPDLSINLSDELEYLNYSSDPAELKRIISLSKPKTVYIDEIQRLPSLLNTIQSIVDSNKKIRFFLTGSSARKLRRGGANLLPGRLLTYQLGPLVASELNYKVDTFKALELGMLPEAYLTKNRDFVVKLLRSYAGTYLKEEIKAEALVRNLESFARFLNEIILSVGLFVDYSKLSKKAKISRHAVPRYFEILEDTMIGNRINAFSEADRNDLIKHPKFYLFDNGVYNALLGNHIASIDRKGILAEQLIINQILFSAWSKDLDIELYSFRTRNGIEVDLVVRLNGFLIAVEIKSSDNINSEDLDGLIEFKNRVPRCKSLYLLHLGQSAKNIGLVKIRPWQAGLKELGL
jgi:predicted AAA+ superfamily ATPase